MIDYVHLGKLLVERDRLVTRLRKFQTDSATKGALPDVFSKSANEGDQPMSESGSVVSVAKRSAMAIEKGEIGQGTLAKLQQRLAQEQFPNDSIGVALAKFYRTPHGAEMLNRGLQKSHEDMQRRSALANAAEVLVAKAHGNPASRQSEYETPDTEEADETPHIGEGDEPFDQKVERLMKERNISRDAAITLIYRAEKIAKGIL
jgi:hypothetical protein